MSTLYIILVFFILGICISILFDIFRITRKSFHLPNIIVYIEDVLFWILTGLLILGTVFTFTTGEIRLYMILMMILGASIYFLTISKYFIFINVKIFNFIKLIVSLLISPFKKIKEKFFTKFPKINGK